MLKTIIFDLDDTLYNYNDLNEQGIKQVCKFTCKRLSLKENQFYEAFNKAKKDVKEELGENVASSHNRLLYCQKTLENLYKNPFSISSISKNISIFLPSKVTFSYTRANWQVL